MRKIVPWFSTSKSASLRFVLMGFLQPVRVGMSGTVPCPTDSGAKLDSLRHVVARVSQHASASKAHESAGRTDDDVIIERDAQKLSRLLQGLGDLVIFWRWLWIAGGMVVRHDDRASVRKDRGLEHFARAYYGAGEVSDARHVNADEIVFGGKHQHDELLSVGKGQEVLGNLRGVVRT